MKKTNIIIIILLLVFCVGCKRTHCPAWSPELNYFPYSKSQELIFVNSQLDTQSFIVARKENSKSESLEWNCKCECAVYTLFTASSTPDSINLKFDILASGLDYGNHITINCNINIQHYKNLYSYKEYISEEIIPDKKFSYEETGKYLRDTISIEEEKNKIIKKMVVIKNKGLISYTTADGEEWKLAD